MVLFDFYLSHRCEIELSQKGKNSENPDLVCKKNSCMISRLLAAAAQAVMSCIHKLTSMDFIVTL